MTGKRDRVGTKAESEITKLFERWLNSTTSVLRAAIFGDNTVRFFVVVMPWVCGRAVGLIGYESSSSHDVYRELDDLHLNAPCVCSMDDCLVPLARDLVFMCYSVATFLLSCLPSPFPLTCTLFCTTKYIEVNCLTRTELRLFVPWVCMVQVSDKHSPSRNSVVTAGRLGRRHGSSTTSTTGGAEAPLFAGNMQGGLSNKYAGEPHLKDPLDPRCAPRHSVTLYE